MKRSLLVVFLSGCAVQVPANLQPANESLAQVVPVRPRDYHTEEFKWGTRPSDIVTTIRTGRSGVMPSFAEELTQRQIWAAAYVVWSWIPEERRGYDDAPADLESLTP